MSEPTITEDHRTIARTICRDVFNLLRPRHWPVPRHISDVEQQLALKRGTEVVAPIIAVHDEEIVADLRQRLTSVAAWAYQLAGLVGAGEAALDNLSAMAQGATPPHEWPVAESRRIAELERKRDEALANLHAREAWICELTRRDVRYIKENADTACEALAEAKRLREALEYVAPYFEHRAATNNAVDFEKRANTVIKSALRDTAPHGPMGDNFQNRLQAAALEATAPIKPPRLMDVLRRCWRLLTRRETQPPEGGKEES